jgi:hypothetical protein
MATRKTLRCFWLAISALGLGAPAAAQEISGRAELAPMIELFRQGWTQTREPMRMTVPVHGGVLEFAMPHGFVPALRVQHEGQFMMAFIPDGESWPDFSQAVLVQSSNRLGSAPDTTAAIAEAVFKPGACAGDPIWTALGEKDVGSAVPAFLASTGCASLADNPAQGQQSLVTLLRGDPDAAALIFARRLPAFNASEPPISPDAARRQIAAFGDIILCRSAEQKGCRDIWAREMIRRNGGK